MRLHNLLRRHYHFSQDETQFFICERRCRLQRPTEYVVAFADREPIAVTRDQFVNLDARLRAEAIQTIDDALAELEDDPEEDEP